MKAPNGAGIRWKGAGPGAHCIDSTVNNPLSLSLSALISWVGSASLSPLLLSDHRILTDTERQTETDWAGMGNRVALKTIMP